MPISNSRFSRFSFSTVNHKGFEVKNLPSAPGWENIGTRFKDTPSNIAIIPNGMEGRPDLIANKIYGTPHLWWVILAANDIIDPFEELLAGKKIKLPIIE
jgi:hypothetical protein